MTNVFVAAYQHPLQTAKAFATLDALSGGRTIVGSAPATSKASSTCSACRSPNAARRTDEAIDAITAALTDEWPEHAGAHWSFKDVGQRPRPVQQPRPPIWIGGYGKPALRRVAARGDGWIPQGTPASAAPRRHRVHPAPPRRRAPRRGAGDRFHHRDGVRRRARLRHRPVLGVRFAAAARRLVQRARRDRRESPAAALREPFRVRAVRSGRAFGAEVGPHLTRRRAL